MVKSVLQSMPMYLFSVLSTPKLVLKVIKSIQRNFLWAGRESREKFSLVSWEKVSIPKEKGGLGLRDPEVVGEVQGAKIWWWWCKYSQEPWVKIWHIQYVRDRPKSQLIRYNATSQGSHIWKKALAGRQIIQEHSFWDIKAGNLAHFWDDSWNQLPKLGNDPRWWLIRAKGLEEGRINVNQYWEMAAQDDQRQWAAPVRGVANVPKVDIRAFISALQECSIMLKEGDDVLRWGYSQRGTFNITKAYNIRI